MPITTSEITSDLAQIDGRRHVTERHVDTLGREHLVSYVALAEEDAAATMLARVPTVNASIKAQEFAALVKHTNAGGSIETFPFVEHTLSEGARQLFIHYHALPDVEEAEVYAGVVVAAGSATVAYILAVSAAAADGVVAWAQGVIDSLAALRAAKDNAALAVAEING